MNRGLFVSLLPLCFTSNSVKNLDPGGECRMSLCFKCRYEAESSEKPAVWFCALLKVMNEDNNLLSSILLALDYSHKLERDWSWSHYWQLGWSIFYFFEVAVMSWASQQLALSECISQQFLQLEYFLMKRILMNLVSLRVFPKLFWVAYFLNLPWKSLENGMVHLPKEHPVVPPSCKPVS